MYSFSLILILFATFGLFCVTIARAMNSNIFNSVTGPLYIPTKGEIWPKPQQQKKKYTYYVLDNANTYNVTKPYHTCDIVDEGVKRLLYSNLLNKFRFIRDTTSEINNTNNTKQTNVFHTGTIATDEKEFRIELTQKCESKPHLDMDENYRLVVGNYIVLSSASVWGILRGLQSFNHLLYFSDDYTEIRINATIIEDFPAYKHRGLFIDTGRHYFSPGVISSLIDSMEMNKLNVLHWRIVDDQSFPYQSIIFPALSKYGAFHSSMVYTKDDIQRLIEQAKFAGIRVIPEFDIPGHVHSWGKSYPNILSICFKYKDKKLVAVRRELLNPMNKGTYKFLKQLYQELNELFPDEYIHLGGDEVDVNCWKSSSRFKKYKIYKALKSIQSFIPLKYNIYKISNRIQSLYLYFIYKVRSLLSSKVKPIFWQDVFDMGIILPEKTIIQVWRNEPIREMNRILAAKNRVLFSSSWLFHNIEQKWKDYYTSDPRQMLNQDFLKSNVSQINPLALEDIVGGEACVWGEMIDETNIFTRVWPNTAAVAERLWSGLNYQMNSTLSVSDDVRCRIEEHICRMRQAGVPVAPAFGPSYCLHEPLRT